MPAITLKLSWPTTTEYIRIDDPAAPLPGTVDTEEFWNAESVRVGYAAQCVEQTRDGAILRFSLGYPDASVVRDTQYLDGRKYELETNDIRWGVTNVTVDLDTLAIDAVFAGDEADSGHLLVAHCVAFREVDANELASLDYTTALRLLRPGHDQIRRQLLHNGHCAISLESCEAVLDLVHIVEAKDGGQASHHNCMLLRSDLHRLFDARLLWIAEDGAVCLSNSPRVTEVYRKEFGASWLDPETFDLVRDALRLRAEKDRANRA